MKLHWAKFLDMTGIGFGYTNHQKQLKGALERNGVEICEEAEIAVTIIPAGNFEPVPGKYNILYTMYETVDIPPEWIPKIKQADLIVVPCEHNKRIFQKHVDIPVEVCWEGVEVDKFTYVDRMFPKKRPFRFLWFGASNERKGYKHMVVAWELFKSRYPEEASNCELLIKTTQTGHPIEHICGYKDGKAIKKKMPIERIFRAGNSIVDTRKLPVVSDEGDSLQSMYHSAHCFVFPTMGEGFGLTLAEAMATGLPCIYTPWSGPVDFISSREGFPLKWKFSEVCTWTPVTEADGSMHMEKGYSTRAASPDVEDIARKMVQVYAGYDKALKRGKKAAERIRRDITWDKSAKSFIKIIEKHFDKEKYDLSLARG